MSRLSRRAALGGAAAAALAPGARAEFIGQLARGQDGWLFPLWEDVRKLDTARTMAALDTIVRTVAMLRQAKIAVVLTIAPSRPRLYADKLPADFQPAPAVAGRYAMLLDTLRRSGALVPDLATPLAALRQSQPEAVCFRADSHWTGLAAEAAATETARQIAGFITLPKSARPGTRLGSPEARRVTGDLLPNLPQADRAAYPPEVFHARRILTAKSAGSGALIEEDGSDVAVVGNSYTNPYLNFTPMLSNQLDRPVTLAWQIGTISPHRILLDYLAGAGFRNSRPKLMVWHHLEAHTEHPCDEAGWWGPSTMSTTQYFTELQRLLAA